MLLHQDPKWTPSSVQSMLLPTSHSASCVNMPANNSNAQWFLSTSYFATSDPTRIYHRDPTFTWPVSPRATLETHVMKVPVGQDSLSISVCLTTPMFKGRFRKLN